MGRSERERVKVDKESRERKENSEKIMLEKGKERKEIGRENREQKDKVIIGKRETHGNTHTHTYSITYVHHQYFSIH